LKCILVQVSHVSCSSISSTRAEGKGQQGQDDDGSNDTSSNTNCENCRNVTDVDSVTRFITLILGVVDITQDKSTIVSSKIGGAISLFKSTSSYWGTGTKRARVKVRTGDVLVDATGDVITTISGTSIGIFTEEGLSEDAPQELIASVGRTN